MSECLCAWKTWSKSIETRRSWYVGGTFRLVEKRLKDVAGTRLVLGSICFLKLRLGSASPGPGSLSQSDLVGSS